MVLPFEDGIEIISLVRALPGPEETDADDIAQHLFQRLAVLLINAQQEKRKHEQHHTQRRRAVSNGLAEQEEYGNARQRPAAEADKLSFGEIQHQLGFYLGQILGDRHIGHYNQKLQNRGNCLFFKIIRHNSKYQFGVFCL